MGKKSKFNEAEDGKKGDTCAICGKPYTTGTRFARHHVDYERDITITLCYVCHVLAHGTGKVYRHPLGEFGRDKQPYEFAKRLIKAYRNALGKEDL